MGTPASGVPPCIWARLSSLGECEPPATRRNLDGPAARSGFYADGGRAQGETAKTRPPHDTQGVGLFSMVGRAAGKKHSSRPASVLGERNETRGVGEIHQAGRIAEEWLAASVTMMAGRARTGRNGERHSIRGRYFAPPGGRTGGCDSGLRPSDAREGEGGPCLVRSAEAGRAATAA